MKREHRRLGTTTGLAALLTAWISIAGGTAWAGSTGQLCIKEKIGGNPPCTANDVRISSLVASGGNITCVPGDLLNLTLTATIESSPARYDIGLWVNETGGSALSDPGGTCYRDYLTPRSVNNLPCSQIYPGDYFNGEVAIPQDTCGDVPAINGSQLCGAVPAPCTGGGGSCIFTTYQFTSTFECADSDNNGLADLGTCSSWDNNTQTDCASELDTDPGTGSKCNCGSTNIGNIFIDPCVAEDCDDGVSCTIDTCDSSSGSAVCSHTPDDSICDDEQFCNGVATCDPLNDCEAGTPPNCSDGQACTDDVCNEENDQCNSTPNNGNCSDGLFCTGIEICDPVNGCQDGLDPDCDDGVGCTVDACDEVNKICTNTPDNGSCDDGLFCTGVEICDPVNDCEAPGGNPCPGAFCDEANDICSGCLVDADCNNGVFCDGAETCGPGGICQPGTPPNCNDGVTCTMDACDEANDSCTNTPSDAFCSDGQFCTGTETCHPTNGCQAGTPPNCADAQACTDDVCNETTDMCKSTANDANCSDGLFCNGNEKCNALTGCQAGTAPDCNDGVGCTVDSCDETNDTCVNSPDNSLCNDGLYCNGVESCNAMTGCTNPPDVDCSDSLDCSLDLCDEANDSCINDEHACICGDGEVSGSEECEPPGTTVGSEICDNLIDDDDDGLIDCEDSADCPAFCEHDPGIACTRHKDCRSLLPGIPPKTSCIGAASGCDANCQGVLACNAAGPDPAIIRFGRNGGPDFFTMHASFVPQTAMSPVDDGLSFLLSNASGMVYRAVLQPGDLVQKGTRYRFTDTAAKYGESLRDGIYQVSVKRRVKDDRLNYSFKLRIYGDFSAATEALMMTQVMIGNDGMKILDEWTQTPQGWILHQRDF